MSGSVFGKCLQVMTWGESHGKGIGVVIDGCPAGMELNEEDIQRFLDRRKPGQSRFTTQRKEEDRVEILSGVFEGRTTGCPIALEVRNRDQRSRDYHKIKEVYRPGHADYSFDAKYGFRDYRGGGRSSGRETIGRVAAGAVAAKFLRELGIEIRAYTKEIGGISVTPQNFSWEEAENNRLYMPDKIAAAAAESLLEKIMGEKDSLGGVVECVITGLGAGVGEPVFDKLDANLAKAIFSIGAVKGMEIGDGFAAARSRGSLNNDSFCFGENGGIAKETNHAGGILGGISDGSPVVFRAAFKPTPSIASPQKSVNQKGEEMLIEIEGRHDPIIVPRAVVVVEAMAALTVTDLLLQNLGACLDKIKAVMKNPGNRE